MATSGLNADIVRFKDGRVEDNVKSRVLSSVVVINYPDGTMQTVPKYQLRSVKIRPVNWPEPDLAASPEEARREEQIRVAEASEKGDTWEPRPEDEKINPWTSAGYGLIPGYSGHFHTDQNFRGYSLSILEGLLLLNAIDFATAKPNYELERLAPILTIFATPFQNAEVEATRIGLLYYNISNGTQTYSLRGGITGRTHLEVQIDASAQRNAYTTARNQAYGTLLAIMLLDGTLSYLAADAWNQGVWTGPPGEQPVSATERGFRSLLFPGWGQTYAGHDTKGLAYMLTGGALLFYSVYADRSLAKAQNDYQSATDLAGQMNLLDTPFRVIINTNDLLALKGVVVYPERLEVEKKTRQRKQAFTITAAFWTFNVLDAIFFSGPLTGVSIAPFYSPEYTGAFSEPGIQYGLAVSWRF